MTARRLTPRAAELVGLFACNSGPKPEHYGAWCGDAEPGFCGDEMECVPMQGHSDYYIVGESVCSLPCAIDADCPEAACSGTGPEEPLWCADDGYCWIEHC